MVTRRVAAVARNAVLVLFNLMVAMGTVAEPQTQAATVQGAVPGEVLMKFDPVARRGGIAAAQTIEGLTVIESIPELGLYRMRLSTDVGFARAAELCRTNSGCEYVESNAVGRGGGGGVVPSDPFFPTQWHLQNTGQNGGRRHADIDATEGWKITRGKPDVTIAVLDSGIDFVHPEFAGRVLPGFDFVNEDADPQADNPHGILVAGVVAANADNNFEVAGVDHHATILPVKVLNAQNTGTTFDLAQGLVFAAGARVINMSLIDYPLTPTLEAALQYARNAGSILVACAGNGGIGDADRSGPGASPLTISVGSTDYNDERASFSATGAALHVMAPGVNVATVSPDGTNSITWFRGCSAAAPIVSGIASLLLSVNPVLTHDNVRTLLAATADDRVGPPGEDAPGRDNFYGYGRVNLHSALERAVTERTVSIDIRPLSPANDIDPNSTGRIPVSIRGAGGFDTSKILTDTLRFGPTGTEAAPVNITFRDLDGDGEMDLVVRFLIQDTGIRCGQTSALLTGRTSDGIPIRGSDFVQTSRCGAGRLPSNLADPPVVNEQQE